MLQPEPPRLRKTAIREYKGTARADDVGKGKKKGLKKSKKQTKANISPAGKK
jgi:hypothetical protein